ncbi:hypothetical protein [Flavobacterium sp. GT3P67]|uniref:hypothetical protein n=1 Tax=Flavobacterium sp. GT3P67 TaxID=2541722 RepID=UPI00104644E0|nr:hypothetical protein [Flavobacterium sp. GT3P67]TDE54190.1 hypothetical protein E0H99_04890 [Flavobacterium sp. GT3P67]
MKTKILLLGAFVALSFFISCDSNEKVQDPIATIETEEITADSNIDIAVDDIANIADDQFSVQKGSVSKSTTTIKSILPDCATVTTVLTDGIWKRTIDFGTQGCALPNGNVLKGKIFITFSNNFTSLEHKITYRLDGFYHNGKKINGTETITRSLKSTDLLAAIHPVSTFTINLTITFENGKVLSRTGTRVREMIEGFSTLTVWEDNVFLVWGYSITKLPNGDIYTSTIKANPLRFSMGCKLPFPVKGTITNTKTNSQGLNKAEAILDFGKGGCDNLATITINGVIKEIHLEK